MKRQTAGFGMVWKSPITKYGAISQVLRFND